MSGVIVNSDGLSMSWTSPLFRFYFNCYYPKVHENNIRCDHKISDRASFCT